MQVSQNLIVAYIFTNVASGFISTVAMTAFMICMLCFSKVKLTKAIRRRLVFGFCFHVLLQSIGTMFSSFLAPKGEALYAIGNIATCDLQG